MKNLIGRKEEKRLLGKLYRSENAEFLAIYGRRRIGKTFLINEFFKNKGVFFEITGSVNASTSEQLLNFHREFCALFKKEDSLKVPKDWFEAFLRLKDTVLTIQKKQKVILFFDELPWLASPKSDFLSALDYYWNRHFSRISNILLIVAGSAASWMISHIINNTGGLYGRLSAHLRLMPFSLSEVREYFEMRRIKLSLKQNLRNLYGYRRGPKVFELLRAGIIFSSSHSLSLLYPSVSISYRIP